MDRIKGENARNFAYRTILHNIITLEYPPGTMVSENELSERLKISRTPVREALLEMRRLNLVESFPQKGSYVTRIDYKLIEDANFIRLSLEIAVVRFACKEGISSAHLKKLHDNIEKQNHYKTMDDVHSIMMELDNEFHRLLFEAVHKVQAYEFMQAQMVHIDRLRNVSYRVLKSEKSSRNTNDHENILYAIEKRDAELAEMIMIRHLTRHQAEKKELEVLCPEYFK